MYFNCVCLHTCSHISIDSTNCLECCIHSLRELTNVHRHVQMHVQTNACTQTRVMCVHIRVRVYMDTDTNGEENAQGGSGRICVPSASEVLHQCPRPSCRSPWQVAGCGGPAVPRGDSPAQRWAAPARPCASPTPRSSWRRWWHQTCASVGLSPFRGNTDTQSESQPCKLAAEQLQ